MNSQEDIRKTLTLLENINNDTIDESAVDEPRQDLLSKLLDFFSDPKNIEAGEKFAAGGEIGTQLAHSLLKWLHPDYYRDNEH